MRSYAKRAPYGERGNYRKWTLGKRQARVLKLVQTGGFRSAYEVAKAIARGHRGSVFRGALKAIAQLEKHGLITRGDGVRISNTGATLLARDSGTSASPPVSRDVLRSRRKRKVRKKTEALRRISKTQLEVARIELATESRLFGPLPPRPRTRGECELVKRPCPWVGCRYNLYLDVRPTGITFNFPDLEPFELEPSCALDVAERGQHRLEVVAEFMNLTRERIRQVEVKAKARLASPLRAIAEEAAS